MSEIDRIFRCPDVTGRGGLGFFRPPFPEFGKVVEKSRPASAFFDHLCPWRREVGISHVQVQKNSGKYFKITKIQKNSEKFREIQKCGRPGPAKCRKMWKCAGRFRQTSENFQRCDRPVPAKLIQIQKCAGRFRQKSERVHSTCPGVFQIDRNLQQIHMRAMSLGFC